MTENIPQMAPLNLPTYSVQLQQNGGKFRIYDLLRERYVALTPEEWVRQHFVHYLISEKGYPRRLMANEAQLNLNGTKKRCDTVVYDRHLQARMIIEYKRPDVVLTQRVFDQISRYNMVMHVDYLVVSNGLQHFCCRMDYARQRYEYLSELPAFNGELFS